MLGDSIFDNEKYCAGGLTVQQHLKESLGGDWRITLLARDGATTPSIARQIANCPADTTHIALSVGGNDALLRSVVLNHRVETVKHALETMHGIREEFESSYLTVLKAISNLKLPAVICTIYNVRHRNVGFRNATNTALTIFNDVILRQTAAANHRAVDLRPVCDCDTDFVNYIEPSHSGGKKIASALAASLTTTNHAASGNLPTKARGLTG